MKRLVLCASIAVSMLAGCGPAAASPTGAIGGTVQFHHDAAPATTVVNASADGATVSGTAVTTFASGKHTVRVECVARGGDTWAFGGTVDESTAEPGSAGDWSAVIVKDGSPQRVGIWLSDAKSAGSDCGAWLAAIDLGTLDSENLNPVESGTLVPPPGAAS